MRSLYSMSGCLMPYMPAALLCGRRLHFDCRQTVHVFLMGSLLTCLLQGQAFWKELPYTFYLQNRGGTYHEAGKGLHHASWKAGFFTCYCLCHCLGGSSGRTFNYSTISAEHFCLLLYYFVSFFPCIYMMIGKTYETFSWLEKAFFRTRQGGDRYISVLAMPATIQYAFPILLSLLFLPSLIYACLLNNTLWLPMPCWRRKRHCYTLPSGVGMRWKIPVILTIYCSFLKEGALPLQNPLWYSEAWHVMSVLWLLQPAMHSLSVFLREL